MKTTSEASATSCGEAATVAPFGQGLGLLDGPVVDGGLVAGGDQVAAHRRAHDSRADPADPRFPGANSSAMARSKSNGWKPLHVTENAWLRAFSTRAPVLSEIAS